MEVHHHPHVEKKSFKEYLLEGLMIFLAVSMGFIAENIREHLLDSEKKKQYVESFCKDLEVDTARINYLLKYDTEKINALETISKCYDTVIKNIRSTNCLGLVIKYSKTNRSFQITDRTLRQLANAGGFRILEREDADSILGYESIFRQYMNFENTVFQGAQDNVRNTYDQIADFKVSYPLQNSTPLQGLDTSHVELNGSLFFVDDKTIINKWFNELSLYLRVTTAQRSILTGIGKKATILLHFYKTKYHID